MSGEIHDADGDVVMAVICVQFHSNRQAGGLDPTLIVKWRKANTQYESRMRKRCADSGESLMKAIASVKNSIEPKFIEVISLYELQTTVQHPLEKVSEDQLLQLIYKRIINLTEQHRFGRVLAVGLATEHVFEDRIKLRCEFLLENLKPQLLRGDILRYVNYERRSTKKNDFALFGIFQERARTQHKYHVMNLESRPKVDKNNDRRTTVKDVKPRKGHEQRDNRPQETPKTSSSSSMSRSKSIDYPTDGHLHCGGSRWLHECPTASGDDRRLLLEKLRANRNGGKLSSKAARNIQLVNGLVTAPYSADSGSDSSSIPQELVDELVELDSDVYLTPLFRPIVVTVAGGVQITCQREVVVDLQLQTAAGIVWVSSVKDPGLSIPDPRRRLDVHTSQIYIHVYP
ncbi:LOW QUALITY PROTEIN: hypothetical protein PHMEG_0002447 [Phytophthora megakarya]|uniref:Uncharacterized protein n=1 Tax=Phytophthora megakarya TaxID=4795 RepID=A0A225WYQ1_9STRA|nr:LOW QUALITY PROTEIN: hypothetical protein PHMEG_0002447 [Phytophthora megakarya]